ncbi:S8 family peptidase [Iodobacter sp. CM08]|uniref:S8 family peptidase n=1 Tax=Iodobacter sp. CM08 TaxID=3085902 RepID=UPI00298246F9|nr:S8 family peptidase [Iodobacter sp. CM08]MDW5416792.1 S8 family peptidase [Iodobacter sp. CM08]
MMKRSIINLAIVALLSAGAASFASADEARLPYIIQLADKPAASYTGDISGLKATKPAAGQLLDINAYDVQAYINYIETKQNNVLATIANAPVVHNYQVVFNGFSAMLTDAEVRKLKNSADVVAITLDQPRSIQTNYTPKFLGLDKPGSGLWSQLNGAGSAGENIIIGVIDTGVWPEDPSFADRVNANGEATHDANGNQVYGAPPASWKGSCENGEGFAAANCNNKLIGAKKFRAQYEALVNSGAKVPHWSDYNSPRDSDSHGSHTASTAGGNGKVAGTIGGASIGYLSGIAPRARLATYKVCWTSNDPILAAGKNNCYGGDSIKAIEAAVSDGVNVLNYSISGGEQLNDPVDLAFLAATNAGVFVAASAGNSGPANMVAHIGPWLTTVAASTHDRVQESTVTLGSKVLKGGSVNPAPLTANLIIAKNAGVTDYASLSPASKTALDRCYGDADAVPADAKLDPAKVAGKIVLCDRGSTALVNKSAAVQSAGGAGMLLANVAGGSATITAFSHVIPTVHLSAADGVTAKTYAAAASDAAQAVFSKSITASSGNAPLMADFSSRGPNRADANVLKPDLTAPGVDILAASRPLLTEEQRNQVANGAAAPAEWQSMQGTSMSSPHVAGLGALLHQLHPTWSPAAIKSALMTSAYTTLNDGQPGLQNGLLPWAQGAGHVNPNVAADPGLVYDVSAIDYDRYLCGQNQLSPAKCSVIGSIQPYNLNVPSLTTANVLGKFTFTRTVTNVSDRASIYTAQAAISGFTAAVSPATLSLAPGESKSFTVTLSRTTAPRNVYQYGALVWSDGTHTVRSPLTAKASLLAAVSQLSSEEASGSKVITIATGSDGKLTLTKGGLKEATLSSGAIATDSGAKDGVLECTAGNSTAGVKVHNFSVPTNNLVSRFALYNSDTQHGGEDDLDLLVMNAAGVKVGASGSDGSNETVQLFNLPAGNYKACVVGYGVKGGNSSYTLSSWIINSGDVGGEFKALAPSKIYVGGTASVGFSWKSLPVGKRYLGSVAYLIDGVSQTNTALMVETNDPLPTAASVTRAVGAGI